MSLMPQLSLFSALPHNYKSKGILFSPNGLAPRGINQIMLLPSCFLPSLSKKQGSPRGGVPGLLMFFLAYSL